MKLETGPDLRLWLPAACLGMALLAGLGESAGYPLEVHAPLSEAVRLAGAGYEKAPAHHGIEAPAAPALTRAVASLGAGGTLAGILARLAPNDVERARFLRALDAVIDPRRLGPGTGLVVMLDPEGRIFRLAARLEPRRFVRVEIDPGGALRSATVELDLVRAVHVAGGRVGRSLRQALGDLPHASELIRAVVGIFQGSADLAADVRTGDELRLVYEIERLRSAPDDLPPFGATAQHPGDSLGPGRILAAEYCGRIVSLRAFWVPGDGAGGGYYDEAGTLLGHAPLANPLGRRPVSSRFSRARRHPITRKVVPHHGVDLAAPRGTPVSCAADGRVVHAGWAGSLGLAVKVQHRSGYATVYGHLDRLADGLVRGAPVRQGQTIGRVGSTGLATGPHLHYEVLQGGRPIDPLAPRAPASRPVSGVGAALARSVATWRPWLATRAEQPPGGTAAATGSPEA